MLKDKPKFDPMVPQSVFVHDTSVYSLHCISLVQIVLYLSVPNCITFLNGYIIFSFEWFCI
jgi:hypothetical protein